MLTIENCAFIGQRAASALGERSGCVVKTVAPFARMSRAIEIWATLLQQAEQQTFAQRLYGPAGGATLRSLKELFLFCIGRSQHTLAAIGLALVERLTALTATKATVKRLNDDANELRAELEEMLGSDGVLLFPSFTTVAPYHGRALLLPVQWIYTAIFNTLQLPGTVACVQSFWCKRIRVCAGENVRCSQVIVLHSQ